MDTSETFIKMCVEFLELWNTWEYQIGDYVVFRDVGRIDQPIRVRLVSHVNNAGTIFLVGDCEFQSYKSNKFYPLPRQDQLQEMLGLNIQQLLDRFTQFCGDVWDGLMENSWSLSEEYFDFSMEQLWLAFVMKEKFNKTWNGTAWQ